MSEHVAVALTRPYFEREITKRILTISCEYCEQNRA